MKSVGFFIVQDIYDEVFIEESRIKTFRNYVSAVEYCKEILNQYEEDIVLEQADDDDNSEEYFRTLVKGSESNDLYFVIHKGSIYVD